MAINLQIKQGHNNRSEVAIDSDVGGVTGLKIARHPMDRNIRKIQPYTSPFFAYHLPAPIRRGRRSSSHRAFFHSLR